MWLLSGNNTTQDEGNNVGLAQTTSSTHDDVTNMGNEMFVGASLICSTYLSLEFPPTYEIFRPQLVSSNERNLGFSVFQFNRYFGFLQPCDGLFQRIGSV